MNAGKYILCLVGAVLLFGSIEAQFEEMINPSDLKQQTVITEPQTLRKGFLRAGLRATFIFQDRHFDEKGKKHYLLGTNVQGKLWHNYLSLSYGVTDWFQAGVEMPYSWEENLISFRIISPIIGYDSLLTNKSIGKGLSDLNTSLRFLVLNESEGRPSISLGIDLTIPTGRKNPYNVKSDQEYSEPMGSGHFALSMDLIIKKVIYPYSFTFTSFYYYNFEGEKQYLPDEDPIRFKPSNNMGAIGGVGVHLNDWIALTNNLSCFVFGEGKRYYEPVEISNGGYNIEYVAAIYFQIRRFRLKEHTSIPLWGKNASADPTYSVTLQFIF